jgi:hypothetical protein
VVASQVYHWEVIFREIFALRAQGVLGGKTFSANLENGGQVISINEGLGLDQSVLDKANETIQGIIAGTIAIP